MDVQESSIRKAAYHFIKNEEREDLAQRIRIRLLGVKNINQKTLNGLVFYIARQEFLMMKRSDKFKTCLFLKDLPEVSIIANDFFISDKLFSKPHQLKLINIIKQYPDETNLFWAKQYGATETRIKQIRKELQELLRNLL